MKVELLFSYKKKCRLKSLNIRFFKDNFTRAQELVFLMYYLLFFLAWHFYVWNLFGKQFCTWKTKTRRLTMNWFDSQCFQNTIQSRSQRLIKITAYDVKIVLLYLVGHQKKYTSFFLMTLESNRTEVECNCQYQVGID